MGTYAPTTVPPGVEEAFQNWWAGMVAARAERDLTHNLFKAKTPHSTPSSNSSGKRPRGKGTLPRSSSILSRVRKEARAAKAKAKADLKQCKVQLRLAERDLRQLQRKTSTKKSSKRRKTK